MLHVPEYNISAITRDLLLSDKFNITSFYKFKGQWIKHQLRHKIFLSIAGELIQKKLDNNENINLNNIKMTRDLIKKTVMDYTYNIS